MESRDGTESKTVRPLLTVLLIVYHSVVDKVEDHLKDAADASGNGDPPVELISSGMGDVFLRLCP